MASTATILAVVNLFLAMALNRSMGFLIFIGMINFAVVAARMMRRNRITCAPAREGARESKEANGSMTFLIFLAAGLMRRNSTSWASARKSARQRKQANGSMEFLIFLQVIACAVVAAGKKRRNEESSSTTSLSSQINHEVFLNFRGKDTRKVFTDILHRDLEKAGIEVFKDDKKLHAGEEINKGLKDAIKRSRISIAIFSKNYASSKSCLMELVQMWECKESNVQTIIPIFYDISPYNVKHQTGDFAKSFEAYEKDDKVDSDTINTWKDVLQQVGGLSGYDRPLINGGHVSDLLDRVLKRVKQVLKKDDQLVNDKLVGIDLHVQEIMTKLGVVYSHGQAIEVCGEDVRVVGICGMQGVGKTTLAKVVYNKIHKLFHGFSFLEVKNWEGVFNQKEISERVKVSQEVLIADLQKENREQLRSSDEGIKKIANRFSKMKVLIVLDDVREAKQIEALVGELTWFGSGSRIIVTTNDSNVFNGFKDYAVCRAVKEHKVEPMGDRHAFQLFREHAFHGNAPQDVSEYDSLSIDIVKAIKGFPLAIVLTASYLSVNIDDIEIWRETLKLIRKNQQDTIKAAFMASYNSLDEYTRKIFLDIACFFIGEDKRIPSYMWKACNYFPARGIKCLCERYFLEIGENHELRMHDVLRDFGRQFVQEKKLRERCRFWNRSALSILTDGNGTESVEGIGLTVEEGCTDRFKCEQFCEMSNLRYLRLDRAKIQGDIEKLPPNLTWLDWRECHLIPKIRIMHLNKLVILALSRSLFRRDTKIWSHIMEKVEKLKVLNLQGCVLLGASLNFSAPINLEMLILEDCTLLSAIGPFISKLENLSSLNLRNCSLVKKLPDEQPCMVSLTELLIDGTGIKRIHIHNGSLQNLEKLSACNCKELEDISTIGRLEKLTSLALDDANIDWDPETFEFPQELKSLSLKNCWKLDELPLSMGKLKLLEEMDLSHTKITELPQSVKDLSKLKMLKMAYTHLQTFPEDIVNLGKLEEIDFSGCRSLKGQVCCDISGLSSLRILRLSSSNVAGLPQSIRHLSCLQTLDILKCNQLNALPELPSSLLSLHWGSKNMTVPDLSYLTNLKELCLKEVQQPKGGLLNLNTPGRWITRLPSLETLELSLPSVTNLPGDFSALTQLRKLCLSYMKELDLEQLPSSSSLWTLHLKHCKIPEPKFSSLKHLSELEFDNCDLARIDGLEDLKLLEVLKITRCSITNLNGLKKLRSLRKVEVFSPDLAGQSDLSGCSFELDTCG